MIHLNLPRDLPAYWPQASSTTRSAPSVATLDTTTWTAYLNESMLNSDVSYLLLHSTISETIFLCYRDWRTGIDATKSPSRYPRTLCTSYGYGWDPDLNERESEEEQNQPQKIWQFKLALRWPWLQGGPLFKVTTVLHIMCCCYNSQWWRNHVWQPHN